MKSLICLMGRCGRLGWRLGWAGCVLLFVTGFGAGRATAQANTVAPTVAGVAPQTVAEGAELRLTIDATDGDDTPNALTYSLEPGAPAGAWIEPATGVLHWTPTEAQGPGSYALTVRVSDNDTPPLSGTTTFNAIVIELASPPGVLGTPDFLVTEGARLEFGVNRHLFGFFSTNNLKPGVWVETYEGIPGGDVGSLTNAAVFPASPTTTHLLTTAFETPSNIGESFGQLFRGFLRAPATGDYRFWISSDDQSTFYLSRSEDPADVREICYQATWSGEFEWTREPGQTSELVPLEAGRLYYFEIPLKEEAGGDHLGLRWQLPDGTIEEPVPAERLFHGDNGRLALPAGPASPYAFSLGAGSPPGATIDPVSGAVSWTTREIDGGNAFAFLVRAQDPATPHAAWWRWFTVQVLDTNSPPVFVGLTNRVIDEFQTLDLMLTASDPDLPSNSLEFALISSPPGVAFNATTGHLIWPTAEETGPGDYPFTVRVRDNAGAETEATFTVTVREVNAAPTLTPLEDRLLVEGETLNLGVTATDTDLPLNALRFRLVSAPPGMTLDPVSGQLAWTTTEADGPSTNLVTVEVSDNAVPPGVARQSFTAIVAEENAPPALPAVADRSLDEGVPFVLEVSATDGDLPPNRLTYRLDTAPAGMAIDPGTGRITWTPTEAQGGATYPVLVVVNDGGSPPLESAAPFSLTVLKVNRAPVLAAVPDQSIDEGAAFELAIQAHDDDLPVQGLTFALIDPPTGAAIDPLTGRMTWTPSEAQGPGTYVLRAQVTDDGEPRRATVADLRIAVREVNQPPVLAPLAAQQVDEGQLLQLKAVATDADLPANVLTFSLANAPAGMTLNAATGELAWTPAENQGPGHYEVTVTVRDNATPPGEASTLLVVEVREVNQAPTLTAVPRQTVVELQNLTVALAAADADVPANTLSFRLVSGPPGLAVNPGSGAVSWTPTEAQGPATYSVTVEVSDGAATPLTARASFEIEVTESNSAPALATVPPQSIAEGTTLVVNLVATDADLPTNRLSYGLVSGPPGMTVNALSGRLAWTPDEFDGGKTFQATVSVTDDGAPPLGHSTVVTVHVLKVNGAPVLSEVPAQTVNEGQLLSFRVEAVDHDLPAQGLTFALRNPPAGARIDPATGVVTWTPSEAQGPSTNLLVVEVTDDGTPPLSATTQVRVVVAEVNERPTFAITGIQIAEGQPFRLVLLPDDPDLPVNQFFWEIVQGPLGLSIDPKSGVLTWTPSEAQGPGTYPVRIYVTDNGVPPSEDFLDLDFTVVEVNQAPSFPDFTVPLVDEQAVFRLQLAAHDADVPANLLSYTLLQGPAGMVWESATRELVWTPTEAQGPGVHPVIVRVADNGSPSLSIERTFLVAVQEVNRPPVLAAIPPQAALPGQLLQVPLNATDPDLPANRLAYTLVSGPSGALVAGHLFLWVPPLGASGATGSVTVQVTDDGLPPLSATQTFAVQVRNTVERARLDLAASQFVPQGFRLVLTGTEGAAYLVEFSDDLVTWIRLSSLTIQGGKGELIDSTNPRPARRFYRALAAP